MAGAALLRNVILLLTEHRLPLVPYLLEVLHNGGLRSKLLQKCANESIATYFSRQFPEVPRSTLGALSRRMDALCSSAGVRLALTGNSAPDMRTLQDQGSIVLINCGGPNIAQSVRRLLQCLVVSDIHDSVFLRRNRNTDFLWFLDEAQSLLSAQRLRDHVEDLLRLSRSFGTHYGLITQNLGAAIPDARLLKIILTNTRWTFSMRGDPGDCDFLRAAFPVTGQKVRPQANPFEEKRFYTVSDERAMALEAIASLPDRTGWLFFKSQSDKAIKIRTRELVMPEGRDMEKAVAAIRSDPSIGKRFSRRVYQHQIAERDREWLSEEPESDLDEALCDAYQKTREKKP